MIGRDTIDCMTKYVALFRGINVGGKMVKMAELVKTLEDLGYTQVKTLLNSGNAVFETDHHNQEYLIHEVEDRLEKVFGFHIDTLILPMSGLKSLVESDPFKNVSISPETRLYATFIFNKSIEPKSITIPYESPEKDFRILSVRHGAICSVLQLSSTRKTPDVMAMLEKEWGKKITTRSWNTVLKLASMA